MKSITINLIRIVLIIIITFISSTIFNFSSQNAEQSSSISGKVARKIIEMQSKYKNITEEEMQELISAYQKPIRKFAHFSIYTLLGMSIAGLICTYKLANKLRTAISLSSGILYAASDELHQTFIEGRSGQVSDVLLDSVGVVLGTVMVLGIYKLIKKLPSTAKQDK